MATTKDFNLRYAAKLGKALSVTSASGNLYGGGTYPTTGATDLMRFDNGTIEDGTEKYTDESTNGTQFNNTNEVNAVLPKFSITTKMWTEGIPELLLACFGYESLAGPKVYSSIKYSHLFSLDTDGKDQRLYTTAEAVLATANTGFSPAYTSGDYRNADFTFAIEKGPYDEKAHNCSVSEFTIKGDAKNPVMLDINGTAEIIVRDTNKAESANWTTATGSAFQSAYFLRNCVAKFGQLGSLVTTSIFDFEIKVAHGQADIITTGTSNSGLSRAEPVATGKTEVDVSFTIAKHSSITNKNLELNDTASALSLDFTKGNFRMFLCMPNLNILEAKDDPADGSKIMIKAKGLLPTAADSFAAERTISGTLQALEYTTPLYMVYSDLISANSMRIGA